MIATGTKLYSRDSKGKVRVWWMEQQGNQYRTCSGLQDGEIVTTDWTTAKGKNTGKANETTDIQQAAREVDNKYKKQRKTGYFDNISDIDSSTKIDCLLAKKYSDYQADIDFTKEEWLLQYKYNGGRCIATKDGLFTREGERYASVPHIEKTLEPFFRTCPEAVLDGELFNEDYRQQLNEIMKLIRKTVHVTEEDIKKSAELIKFYVYDGYGFDNTTEQTPYSERKAWLDANVIVHYGACTKVPQWTIRSLDDLMERYQNIVAQGHEGVILRKADMPYHHGRSKNLLKFKPTEDAEGKILAITEGNGNWAGKAKIITIEMDNGKVFDATFKGTMEDAAICLKEAAKWINKRITYQFFGYTGLGTPNYAQFDYRNCLNHL